MLSKFHVAEISLESSREDSRNFAERQGMVGARSITLAVDQLSVQSNPHRPYSVVQIQSSGKVGPSNSYTRGCAMPPVSDSKSGPAPIIVDLGKQSRKKVKRLRRGDGPLMADVSQVLSELQAAGKISASALPVVIVVREKEDSLFPFLQ
jgi:hypothetical protein